MKQHEPGLAQPASAGALTDGEQKAKPQVSIIIPAYKASKTMRACLDSVFASKGVSFEVIVVNDCSPDDSEAIAREYPCQVISMKKNIMAASCRNLGARHAAADILVFFDSDQVMMPNTLQRYLEELAKHPEADAIVGSLAPDTPMEGFYSKFKNLRHHYVHQTGEGPGCTLASGLTAMHKNVFEQLGGFEPSYNPSSIEDVALGMKMAQLGHTILFRGDIWITHLKGYTLKQLIVSDVRDRAVPWVALMIRGRTWKNKLNTSNSNVASVIFSWLLVLTPMLAIVSGWRFLLATLACTLIVWALNTGFARACYQYFGLLFTLKSLLFMPVMYFYMGIGLIVGLVAYARENPVTLARAPVDAKYEIYEWEKEEAAM